MGFQCRQFYLKDDRCAMKVSTDSLLFGSWLDIEGVERAADFGCGCGILALMLAQRLPATAHIDAIELASDAAQQARENVLQSPWPTKISVHEGDVISWSGEHSGYDLIAMNPPYFAQHLNSKREARQLARQGQGQGDLWLSWLQRSKSLLRGNGRIALVAPYQAAGLIDAAAAQPQLFKVRCCQVKSIPTKTPYLILLELALVAPRVIKNEQVTIRNEQNKYTDEFRQLTGAFYLN